MSRADVEEYVWKRLSPRRWMAGRVICDRLTRRAIRAWDRDVPRLNAIGRAVEEGARQDVQMGIIASWILAALVNEIVHVIWQWFNSSHANRCLIYAYQRELPDDEC